MAAIDLQTVGEKIANGSGVESLLTAASRAPVDVSLQHQKFDLLVSQNRLRYAFANFI